VFDSKALNKPFSTISFLFTLLFNSLFNICSVSILIVVLFCSSLKADEDPIVGSLKKMAYSSVSSNGGADRIRERPSNGNTVYKPTQVYLEGIIHNGEKTLDIMLPGNKVGYVIGKGGEMIRSLQVSFVFEF
jgi:hypothetical protein